jgi:hypothetical protein
VHRSTVESARRHPCVSVSAGLVVEDLLDALAEAHGFLDLYYELYNARDMRLLDLYADDVILEGQVSDRRSGSGFAG